MLTYGITIWVETQKQLQWREAFDLQHKAKKDGLKKRLSGTQDSTNQRRLKGEQEDQPKDRKTT